ncbi:MAG: hypothetical protein ACXW2D_15805 [Burkholderiaceae bacterium]
MRFFDDLGRALEARWMALGFDERRFPALAEETLRSSAPHRQVTASEIIRWVTQSSSIPTLVYGSTFGEPAITVFRGQRFYIEVLFWVDSTTAIHQHSFSGAFMVLAGSSIHTRFRFRTRQRINSHISLGVLSRDRTEYLRTGDSHQISPGDGLIHSLFHLDRPSVSLVVRTDHEPGGPQFSYYPPGLAVDPFYKEPILESQLQLLQMLRKTGSADFFVACADVLQHTDYYGATQLFFQHYEHLREHHPRELSRLLAIATRRHGKRTAPWRQVFAEFTRSQEIAALRATVQNPDHRFFLALLMNVADQRTVYRLIARRFPRRDPRRVVLTWVKQLAAQSKKTSIPIDLDDDSLVVFEWLLDHLPTRQILARVKRLTTPAAFAEQKVNVTELLDRLHTSLFRPLFV